MKFNRFKSLCTIIITLVFTLFAVSCSDDGPPPQKQQQQPQKPAWQTSAPQPAPAAPTTPATAPTNTVNSSKLPQKDGKTVVNVPTQKPEDQNKDILVGPGLQMPNSQKQLVLLQYQHQIPATRPTDTVGDPTVWPEIVMLKKATTTEPSKQAATSKEKNNKDKKAAETKAKKAEDDAAPETAETEPAKTEESKNSSQPIRQYEFSKRYKLPPSDLKRKDVIVACKDALSKIEKIDVSKIPDISDKLFETADNKTRPFGMLSAINARLRSSNLGRHTAEDGTVYYTKFPGITKTIYEKEYNQVLLQKIKSMSQGETVEIIGQSSDCDPAANERAYQRSVCIWYVASSRLATLYNEAKKNCSDKDKFTPLAEECPKDNLEACVENNLWRLSLLAFGLPEGSLVKILLSGSDGKKKSSCRFDSINISSLEKSEALGNIAVNAINFVRKVAGSGDYRFGGYMAIYADTQESRQYCERAIAEKSE